jgi:ATP-dependent Clp protease ATP-binding subunit ClpA
MTIEQNSHDHVTAVALRAIAMAQSHYHETVTLEHILAALLERPEVQRCFKDLGIDRNVVQTDLTQHFEAIGSPNKLISLIPSRTREFDIVIGRTVAYAQFSPRRFPTGVDILFQLMQYPETSHAVALMLSVGMDTKKLKNYIAQSVRQPHRDDYSSDFEPSDKAEAVNYIKKYCIDLNDMANAGKVDPVIGRLDELARIVQIISRRNKNNVALVGDAGVGKTALVEGLAYNIVKGNVPNILKKATVWALDVGALVAGTRFRGDFEERMKFLLKGFSLIEEDEPILFIDEIHTIIDAGTGNKGSLDISNILKPALARGKLRCIGATTERDWRQHFEKDRALLRRFKKLFINEPSVEDSKLILRGIKGSYETFHGVTFTDAALDAAVDLTRRYVNDGKLPDMAIDLIDEAGARCRVLSTSKSINIEDIEFEISQITKIPPQNMREDETVRLERLEDDIKTVVFGQDEAIGRLVDAVLISRAGLRDHQKPEGCFLFTGSTGVGKSESAKQLAKTLGLPLVKFDMSEFMERHSVSRFIGSAPGYVGYEDGGAGSGLLVNAIDRTPACVLLLDEIEKAHPDVFNLFLQVMEDSILTNSAGKPVNFRNVILIMTSNAGVAKTEHSTMGFARADLVEIDDAVVKQLFSPEFRNRLDAVVTFKALDRPSIVKVVQKFIDQMQDMLVDRNVTIEMTEAAKKWLVEHGYDPIYGARPLNRLITEKVKRPLSRMMLFGSLKGGGTAKLSVENSELIVR